MKTLQELEQQVAELQKQIEDLKAKPLNLDDLELKDCNRWYINQRHDIYNTKQKYSVDTAFFTKQEAYAFQQWNKVRRAWLQFDGACSESEANCFMYLDISFNCHVLFKLDPTYLIGNLNRLYFKSEQQAQAFIDFMQPYGAWNKETYELK